MAHRAFSFARGNLAKLYALPLYALSASLSWIVPRAKHRWVFGSGGGFGEGARALALELRRVDPVARIRWLTAGAEEEMLVRAAGFVPVRKKSARGFWETLRARTVVVTHGLGDVHRFGVFGATVVQLWHGAPLKRLHLDSAVTTQLRGPAPLRGLLRRMYRIGSDRISLFVVGSETAAERIQSAFTLPADRLRVLGDPRDDDLVAQATDPELLLAARARVRRLLGLPADPAPDHSQADPDSPGLIARRELLVLYAPTWRDGEADPAVPNTAEAAAIHAWAERIGARLVIRSHPLGAGAYEGVLGGRVSELGASIVRDITPHLGAFDALVTDYSSIAIDFALLGRPIVWFAPDLEAYEATRGLYEPLETTSGGTVQQDWASACTRLTAVLPTGDTGSDVAHRAANADSRALAARFHAFPEGHAAARVLAWIQCLSTSKDGQSAASTKHIRFGGDQPIVFFESFYGRQVSCNPLPLDAEIARRVPQAHRFWSVTRQDQVVPNGATAVLEGSSDWHRTRREADLVIVNDWLRRGFRRRRGQTVLQTWHGTMLKHLALDRPRVSLRTKVAIRRESSRWDFMLSQNPHSSAHFRSSYAFRGAILETGYPRDDRLARAVGDGGRNPTATRDARETLGISAETQVLAYLPTWRDAGTEVVDLIDVARLAHELGPNWVVVARGHTRTHELGSYANVIDASRHPDVNDVILAADLLVTDYSSVMFDVSVAQVPQLFFVPDLARYRDRERGFTFDFEADAPGPLVSERSDVVRLAHEFSRDGRNAAWITEAEPRVAAWRARFNPHDDGYASARVVSELQRRGILPAGQRTDVI